MKLNKSHILLISLISLVLLISVSAVSAASDIDNVASDVAVDDVSSDMGVDDVSSDSATDNVDSSSAVDDIDENVDINNNIKDSETLSQVDDDVISEDPEQNGENPVEPTPTTINVEDKTFKYGDNITFDFTLKDNESNAIENTTADDYKVFYKNETAENFTKLSFSINNNSQFVFKQLAIGNYTINIQFLNKTINGISYLESETNMSLNITQTDTTINATDTKVKIGSDVIIPLKLYVESGKTLNVNASRIIVYLGEEEFNCTNETGGNNISKGIKIKDFNKAIGSYIINITYLGNNNCNPSNKTITLTILGNNTIYISDAIVDKNAHNITLPICVNNTVISYDPQTGKNITTVTTLDLAKDDLILVLVYDNGAEKVTEVLNSADFELDSENGKYNITFIKDVPLNDAKLTIIYKNNTLDEANKTIAFSEKNTIIYYDNVSVDYQSHNITIPISINSTSKITGLDGKEITNVTVLNLNSEDFILVLVYNDGTGNITVNLTNGAFSFDGEEGKYNISFVWNVPLNDAKLTIIYKNGTLSQTNKTIVFSVNNQIFANDTKFNNHTHNVTIPISINSTNKITVDGKEISDISVLNLTKDDLTLVLVYNDGTDNITVVISKDDFALDGENGTYNISFVKDLPLDNANLTIIYGNATLNETNKTVTLKGFLELYMVPVNTTNDYQDGYFIYKVLDIFDDSPIKNTNITVEGLYFYTFGDSTSFGSSKTFTTDANGLLKIKNENMHTSLDILGYSEKYVSLPVGKYNLTFRGSDSLVLDYTSQITVNKVKAKIVASNIADNYGNVVKYTFKVVNANTNAVLKNVNVVFRIKGGSLDATRSGIANLSGIYTSPNINLTAGKYSLILSTNDTNLIAATATKTLTVNKILATITASSRTIYYSSGTCVVAKVKDKKTGKAMANTYLLMQFYLTSKKTVTYAVKTDSKGNVKFSPATPLTVGKHKLLLTVYDNNYNSTVLTRYVTVKKATAKFSASNVNTYYRSGKLFKIKVVNAKNKVAMSGVKLLVKVFISKNKYYKYNASTGSKGLIQFKISYKPGTYKVVISSDDKGYTAKSLTKKIRVAKAPIKMTTSSLKVKKGKYLKVKVTSKKSKKALSSVKVKIRVYTGKKYKTYTKKTNKKGIASLKITQKLGKHKIVIYPAETKLYSAKKLSKTLKVVK